MPKNVVPDAIEDQLRMLVAGLAAEYGEATVKQALAKLFGKNTAADIWAELFPVPQPQPDQDLPPPAGSWRARLARQFLLMDAPAYFWRDMQPAEVNAWMKAVAQAGLDGVDIELNGPFPVWEYLGSRVKNLDVAAEYERSFKAIVPWVDAARKFGLIVSLKVLNSNQSDANSKSDSWWKGVGLGVAALGAENLIVLPLNETDARTRASIGKAIEAGLISAGFPEAQLIGYGKRGGKGFAERHPQKGTDIVKGDHTLIQVSDSGGAIEFLYGKDWRNGGKVNAANLTAFVRAIRNAGTSGGIYSFGRNPDPEALAIAAKAWGAAVPNDGGTVGVGGGTGERIVKLEPYTNGDQPRIKFELAGIEGWPVEIDKKTGKRLKGWIMVNGVKVESFKEGQTDQHLDNAFGTGEHSLNILKGEPATLRFTSRDGKRQTDARTFAWPWRSA